MTTRAVLIGALAAMAWAAISPYTDHYARLTWGFGWGALPAGPVAFAFLLVAVNGVLRAVRSRYALSRAEVLIVYCMLTIAAAVVVVHNPYALPIAAYPQYHARVALGWDTTVLPYLPTWLHPSNPERMSWFWEGLPKEASLPWSDWLVPASAWGGFALASIFAMLCLGSLMRKDWIERQRLAFPLTEIPLAMVGERQDATLRGSAFGQRAFWLGFALAGTLTLLVWLNKLFPAVPAPTLVHDVGQHFDNAGLPMSALSDVVVRIAPATIGVLCLIPTEVSFSLWAFYALFYAFLLVCGSFGLPPHGTQAMGSFNPRGFADYAGAGGFVLFSAMVVYQSRGAVRAGLRSLLRREREAEDRLAPMTNGAALVGFVLANGFMLWWAIRAGMSWWSFGLIMVAFYVSMIGTSRLVAAAGLTQPRPQVSTRWTVIRTVGASALGPRSLAMYSYLTMGFMLEPQNLAILYMMNSFKLIHGERIAARRFPAAAVITTVGALLAGGAGLLYVAYHYGAVSMECWPITAVPTCAFREFGNSLRSPERADNWLRFAMVVGAGVTLALFLLSSRFVWWPFTPIGFIVASVYHTNQHVWTNALIAWLLTTLVRRYGGLRLYRGLRPAFLGLVLGQLLIEVAMAIFSTTVLGARGLPSVSF
ncbi:MAG: hypothetical protein JSV79_11020 [Armatimonadota bacterium]|nr:MAG: hypothetical protein JSV79_11020 [Armatimonadota bacterium]